MYVYLRDVQKFVTFDSILMSVHHGILPHEFPCGYYKLTVIWIRVACVVCLSVIWSNSINVKQEINQHCICRHLFEFPSGDRTVSDVGLLSCYLTELNARVSARMKNPHAREYWVFDVAWLSWPLMPTRVPQKPAKDSGRNGGISTQKVLNFWNTSQSSKHP
jgi:hypothetical protein